MAEWTVTSEDLHGVNLAFPLAITGQYYPGSNQGPGEQTAQAVLAGVGNSMFPKP